MAHVNERKKTTVKLMTEKLKEYPIIGVLNMEQLPGKNLAKMRKQLRDDVEIIMAKKRLIRIAFKDSGKKDIEKLDDYLKGMPALLFTKENPFKLFKTLKKNQSPAPIKAGQESPRDIVIPAGPTQFPPGPIIGELGQMGIKAGIENGKVAIKVDATVAKEGEVVNEAKAGLITRFGIEPMRIGLSLTAVYEDGDILTSKVLDIDEDQYIKDLQMAVGMASNLAFSLVWPTSDNINTLIQKAHYDAAGLALEAELLTDSNARDLLSKAYWQAVGVAKYLPEDIRGELPEPPAPIAEPTAQEKPSDDKKEAPEDEKKSEEDAAAGLGALFG